jgi:hypothetical protein
MRCLAELYAVSARCCIGLPELIYPFHDRDVIVTTCGPPLLASQEDQHLSVLSGRKLGQKNGWRRGRPTNDRPDAFVRDR